MLPAETCEYFGSRGRTELIKRSKFEKIKRWRNSGKELGTAAVLT